ncbi:hypothetical protein DL93DRAFT_2073797 [Clavulina sp. PMI_390]|nr:hypothetical protein DL93DRAFT_2073797 [Clavulina sp. PMI_390]
MSYQLLPRDASSPIPQPITTGSSGPPSRRRSLLTFVGIAAASGIIFHLIFTFGFAPGSPPNHPDSLGPSNIKDWWSNTGDASYDSKGPAGTTGHGSTASCPPPSTLDEDGLGGSTSYIRPGLGQYVEEGEDEWTMDKIRTMVEGTKGYYVRDWSLGLGWNNMRYIIETSLLHANLLNRTLVLPSFVYARACEWNITVCASFAEMVNRGDAIGWGEWRELPIEEQMCVKRAETT